MSKLRKCLYHGNKFLFHRWFQEGDFEEFINGPPMNIISVGAILENPYSGQVKKVYDIEHIELKGEIKNDS